jgi:hypothetical protein
LGGVLGELSVAEYPYGDRENKPAILLIQRTHGVVVAVAESFHHGRIETCIWHLMIVADGDQAIVGIEVVAGETRKGRAPEGSPDAMPALQMLDYLINVASGATTNQTPPDPWPFASPAAVSPEK